MAIEQNKFRPSRYDICVCDDSKDDVELLQRAFRVSAIDHQLRVFRSGQELLNHLDGTSAAERVTPLPQILLLDLKMPQPDGFAVLKIIKSDARFKNIFVVVLSGYDLGMIDRAYREGAHSYLIKPPNPVDISNLTRFFDGWKRLNLKKSEDRLDSV